jgi:hypothetical protein
MSKCRGCGEDTTEYNAKGVGPMHFICEIKRLTTGYQEQLDITNNTILELSTLRTALKRIELELPWSARVVGALPSIYAKIYTIIQEVLKEG